MEHVSSVRPTGKCPEKVENEILLPVKKYCWNPLEFPNGISCSIYAFLLLCTRSGPRSGTATYRGLRPNVTTFYQSEIPLLVPPKFRVFLLNGKRPRLSSAIHRRLSRFFLSERGRLYTGYPIQMFLICPKSCNTLYTRLHPVRCEKCNSCTLYCQLPLILMITVTKIIMMMVKIMRKKTIYSRTSVSRTKSRFSSFCRGGEGKKEGGGWGSRLFQIG